MKVYCVMENQICEDEYYTFDARTVGIYASEQDALDAVASHEQECKRDFEKEEDESTHTIDGKKYRHMDLEYIGDRTYRYVPKAEYDYEDLWRRFPEQYVQGVTIIEQLTKEIK